nr:multidrug resistance-associated protein 5 [Tanacetum cinerariifolium]
MFDVEETFGRLELYLDHLDMDVSEYLSQAITSGSSQHPQKTNKGKEKVSQDEINGVEARTSTIDNSKEKVSHDEIEGVEARTSTVDSDYDSDDDNEYDSYKLVDYLSPGKEELIKLRNRMKANREAKSKAKGKTYSKINEPNDENGMHADNVKGETFEEYDIYMNELLTRLKNIDEDGKLKILSFLLKNMWTKCLTYYDMANGFSLWYKRISGKKVVAKYGQRPPRFSVLDKGKQRKQSRNFNFGSLVNYKWIRKVSGDKNKSNPYIRLCDIDDLVMKKYKCKVTPNQCTNAKKYALTSYEKTIREHYAMLRSHGKEIIDLNPGSTVMLEVSVNPDDKTYFDRFYVCLAGLADGWKAWCRKVNALDGYFLKSHNQGEILNAIRRDGNNRIYLVAWAVVNVENKEN